MQSYVKNVKSPVIDAPVREDRIESAEVKRCGVCWRMWEASAFILEDGQERCPTCTAERTETFKAQKESDETAYAADRSIVPPQVSQAPLTGTFPGTIGTITDANGARVYGGAPLNVKRNIAATLLLNGRSFTAADTITGAAGLTFNVSARTSTLTTLSITAALSMTPGKYGMTFNNVDFNELLTVR